MQKESINISDAELEIMKSLWNEDKPISTQLINKAVEYKKWKRTTISTLLTRLVEKGAISSEKQGNLYYYTALISAKEYRKAQTKSLIKSLYNGSSKELASCLFEDGNLSQSDIKELEEMFKE